MMKRVLRIITLSLILSLFSPISVFAEETRFGQMLDDLEKAQKELSNNQKSINNTKGQINSDNATIKKLKNDIEEFSKEQTKLQEEIVQSTTDIEKKKEQTKSIITYYQVSKGENVYLDYVFGGETITDVVYRLAVVEQITEYNDKVIKELKELIKKNEDKKKELAAKEKEYEKKIEDLNNEISKLNNTVSKLGDLSPGLEQEVKTKKELVEFYKSQGCKNRNDVIGRDCAVNASNGIFYRPIKKGYITSFIGYRCLSNVSCGVHRGLDIGSPDGRNTPLYSIGYGRVTSKWRDQYGANNINIEYYKGGVYYTAIYAHLSRYGNVYEGMQVTPDTIVGYMGDTGYAFGVHLHLELWPCRLYVDNNCRTWNKYVDYVNYLYRNGKSKGAETYINFPSRTYQYWYNK